MLCRGNLLDYETLSPLKYMNAPLAPPVKDAILHSPLRHTEAVQYILFRCLVIAMLVGTTCRAPMRICVKHLAELTKETRL